MPESDDLQPDPTSRSRSPSSSTSHSLDRQPPPPQEPLDDEQPPPRDGEDEDVVVTRSGNPPSKKAAGKKRSKPLSDKRRAIIQEKLDLLGKNLRPVPFIPSKALDFSNHERLFKTLSLWDFAHVDLSAPLRTDFLAQLIANYDPPTRRSRVNGARIAVSRPDLARALGLSWKKEKAANFETNEADPDLLSREESIEFLLDFLSTWVLLQEEDACILPAEVMTATQLVREGQANKVDWSGLLWTMVEKELTEAPVSGFCYYASHLQRLIKHQKPGIFESQEEEDCPPNSICSLLRPCEDVAMDDVVDPFEGLNSTDLLQAMEPVSDQIKPAEIDEMDGEDKAQFKKMRTEGAWGGEPVTADKCVAEAQSWMEKAKMVFSQREQESAAAQLQAQYMSSLLQQKDHHIQLLEKARLEEQQRREMEICQVEHELMVMAKIVQGYRKALNETRQAFALYRKRFPQGDEQLYVDDGEGQGDVLTASELERRRALKEEEREAALQMVHCFEDAWLGKFRDHERRVDQLERRVCQVKEKLGTLRT
ncbi:uncharacterized protein LOC144703178 [Wolffia australiana]